MLHRLLQVGIILVANIVCAATIDVSSLESLEFRQGAELQYEFPYPDLHFLDQQQPVSLFWDTGGRLPSLPVSSYRLSAKLESLDANTSIPLADVSGGPTTLCLDGIVCNVHQPGIIFIFQYNDALGLSTLVGGNTVSAAPALWLLIRNEGPSIVIGIPGGTLGSFGLTWGNAAQKGVETSPVQVLLADVPEPSTMAFVLICLSALACKIIQN